MIHWWLFPLGIVLDLLWVLWMNAVQREEMWWAGFWGTLVSAIGIFAITDIVHQPMQSIPYLSGLFFGSVLGVYLKKKKRL